jgi:hypothetical protein
MRVETKWIILIYFFFKFNTVVSNHFHSVHILRNCVKYSESEIKMAISLVKLSFSFNSEITVFNRYLYKGGWLHILWSDTHYSISLRYARNIVQLNSFYIKFDSKHFFFIYIINTITNWRVSLSKICHEWPNKNKFSFKEVFVSALKSLIQIIIL